MSEDKKKFGWKKLMLLALAVLAGVTVRVLKNRKPTAVETAASEPTTEN